MFGNTIIINGNKQTAPCNSIISYKNIICENHMIKKFSDDKIFAETEEYIIMLDGVILNKTTFLSNGETWKDVIIKLYEEQGESFFCQLRGSFAGALYVKAIDKWIIFGDQIGSKFIFYSHIGDFFCCSQVMGYMYDILKRNKISYHLNEQNALLLLTCGYMVDDRTLCDEIKKINPGCYIVYQNGKIEEKRYYILKNNPIKISESDAIELIDEKFRAAVKLQFDKDQEYNYSKHLVALSGGLDCRMCSVVAHDLGYTNQVNITFSQSGYWDQTEPLKMARDMQHEWLYKSLDGGIWLYGVDDIVKITGGNVLYYGSAHEMSMLNYMNFDNFGMIHSGQLGDVVLGSWISAKDKDKKYLIGDKGYSQKYVDFIKDIKLSMDLDAEIGCFYYRGFNGTNNGLQPSYSLTETFSPFYEIDFMETSLSLPVELRQHHKLYKKWILRKYPFAAKYVWESTGLKISEPTVTIMGRGGFPFKKIPTILANLLNKRLGLVKEDKSAKGMNPVAYYLETNPSLIPFFNSYFDYVEKIPEGRLRYILNEIKTIGTSVEIIQAVSLLSAIKLFNFEK